MDQVSGYLHDMVGQAVDMAQVVVDIVKEILSIISAGWSMAAIPIYGEIKLVDKVKDAIKLVNDARKVITVFWNALKMVIDGIKMTIHAFQAESLPAAPALPALVSADGRRPIDAAWRELQATIAGARVPLWTGSGPSRPRPPRSAASSSAPRSTGELGPQMQSWPATSSRARPAGPRCSRASRPTPTCCAATSTGWSRCTARACASRWRPTRSSTRTRPTRACEDGRHGHGQPGDHPRR